MVKLSVPATGVERTVDTESDRIGRRREKGMVGKVRTGFLRAAIVISAFLVALAYGQHVLATTYAVYDDEGYMLLSFSHYFAGGHLYTQVFSQYGPFNFFAERFLFQSLQLPVTHDAGRLVALICWLLSAILAGYFTFRLSKSIALASAAGLATMVLGSVLAEEPGHPQQLILPLLMLACCASVSRRRVSLLLLGILGAALFFLKINVGVFYFVAIAQTLVCEFPAGRIRKLGAGFLLAFAVGGPMLLMRQDLQGWARNYCVLAIICGVSTLIVAFFATPSSGKPMRNILCVAAGAVSAAALIIAETIREGMSTATLAEGVLWAPLKHPRVFEYPLRVSTEGLIVAVLASACIVGLYFVRDRWLAYADWVDGLRCVTGLGVIAALVPTRLLMFPNHTHEIVVALLPLGLIPVRGRSWQLSDLSPRLFVTILAATQFLQAYPVAGSQRAIAVAPLLLWAFICVHDGNSGLFSLLSRATNRSGPYWQESLFSGLLALAIGGHMVRLGAWPRHYLTPPSSLPGAMSLHLPGELEDRYEFLARNIKANCSMLFTMPGMGSLNFWSGVPTPNGLNHNDWMRSLSLDQQQQILRILKTNPRSCVIYNDHLVHFWQTTDQELVQLPLAHYILFDMRKVGEKDGYSIFVESERDSPWVEVGTPNSP